MRLLVVRHADAADPVEFMSTGLGDDQRPLIAKGRTRMRSAAQGIHRQIGHINRLLTSPYVRAVQTAEILADCYTGLEVEANDVLISGFNPEELWQWLQQEGLAAQNSSTTVAVVGHEPDLSRLITWFICKRKTSSVKMKKGAACLLDLPVGGEPGNAMVLWLMNAAQLSSTG